MTRETPMETNARINGHELKMEFEDGVSFRLDECGRWSMYRNAADHFQRGLNGRVYQSTDSGRQGVDDPAAVHQMVLTRVAAVSDQVGRGQLNLVLNGREKSQSRLLELLNAGLEWDIPRYLAEVKRYQHTYPETRFCPPPDRMRDMVLLTATGYTFGLCSLGDQGAGAFRPLSAKAFKDHLERVLALLGPAALHPDGVFLGSWNGLGLSNDQFDHAMEALTAAVTLGKRGVAAYMDPDHAPVRYREDFWHLAEMGLSKIIVTLGSTHTGIRHAINRNVSLDPIKLAVREPKRAGIDIGLTLLSHAPDPALTQSHRDDVLRVLGEMELTKKDMVYLYPPPQTEGLTDDTDVFAARLKDELGVRVVSFDTEDYLYQA